MAFQARIGSRGPERATLQLKWLPTSCSQPTCCSSLSWHSSCSGPSASPRSRARSGTDCGTSGRRSAAMTTNTPDGPATTPCPTRTSPDRAMHRTRTRAPHSRRPAYLSRTRLRNRRTRHPHRRATRPPARCRRRPPSTSRPRPPRSGPSPSSTHRLPRSTHPQSTLPLSTHPLPQSTPPLSTHPLPHRTHPRSTRPLPRTTHRTRRRPDRDRGGRCPAQTGSPSAAHLRRAPGGDRQRHDTPRAGADRW
jgi:hypothetical protein